MKKKTKFTISIFAIIVVAVIIGIVARFSLKRGTPSEVKSVLDVHNMTYTINGETFTLVNSKAQKPYAPGSAIQNRVSLFGNPVYGDLDGDGDTDAAVMLLNAPGGSGTFYYAVLVVNNGTSAYKATNAILLGDRIAPQTVEIHDGRALYNFAERRPNEPMTTQPSIGKSVWIHYDAHTGEISQDSK